MLHVVYALNKGLKQLWEHIEEKKTNIYNIPKAPFQSSTDKLWCFHAPECVLVEERSTLLFPYWNCSCVNETEKHVVYFQLYTCMG